MNRLSQIEILPQASLGRVVGYLAALGGAASAVLLVATAPAATTAMLAGLLGASAMAATAALLSVRPDWRARFVDVLVVSLAAVSADAGTTVWQVPGDWSALGRLTVGGAAAFSGLYLAVSAACLAHRGRSLLPGESASLLAVPAMFNLLLALGSQGIVGQLGGMVSWGFLSSGAATCVGRTVVLFAFNEAMVAGVGYALDRRWCRDRRLHVLLAVSSLGAAMGPEVADLGSVGSAAGLPFVFQIALSAMCSALAQGGLWAQTFMSTGILCDALHRRRPVCGVSLSHWRSGFGKGAIFGFVFLALIQIGSVVALSRAAALAAEALPLALAAVAGAVCFPLCRTLLESFDGGRPFFGRLGARYQERGNYLRGAVAGLGMALAVSSQFHLAGPGCRFLWGGSIGALSFAGVDALVDCVMILRGMRSRLQGWRVYALGAALGGMVGGALAWYFDAAQVPVVAQKLAQYAAASYSAIGRPAEPYIIYPLFSKWGAMHLGTVSGAARLLYSESLSGVINWSLAAPLFSINLVLLTALVTRSLRPLGMMFTRQGVISIAEQLVRVLRWGLWMAPVIYSLLRMAPDPAWYNQDGAVRSLLAVVKNATLPPESFRAWSLEVFLGLLAYDWLRILIWFDHMGLRVATLVNLSFVGGDALDERAARALGHRSRTRCLPEGIRRFFTWAPLLIPFYIPRGAEWAQVWTGQETLKASGGPMLPAVKGLLCAYLIAAATVLAIAIVLWRRVRRGPRKGGTGGSGTTAKGEVITNGVVAFEWHPHGGSFSRRTGDAGDPAGLDITRRPSDPLQLVGKFLYLHESTAGEDATWSLGPAPCADPDATWTVTRPTPTSLRVHGTAHGVQCELRVTVPPDEPVEIWEVTLTNLENRARRLDLTSFQEWAMNAADACLRRPAFNALHLGTCFVRPLRAILAQNRLLKDRRGKRSARTAFHAVGADAAGGIVLTGYEDSRQGFIGEGSLGNPAGAEQHRLRHPEDEGLLYTFDPAACLQISLHLPPGGQSTVRFLDGIAEDPQHAARLIARHLSIPQPDRATIEHAFRTPRSLRDSPPQAAQAPHHFSDDGWELHTTWPTPRPWAHVMANPHGYGVIVRNDGVVYSFARNAQQNGVTPFSLDADPSGMPGQGLVLVDLETGKAVDLLSVAGKPPDVLHEATYAPGCAVLRRKCGLLETEVTIFVPHDLKGEMRLLRIVNHSKKAKRFRVVPWFEIMLAEVRTDSRWKVDAQDDASLNALFFRNPENAFVQCTIFVTTSLATKTREIIRSRFVGGKDRDFRNPYFVEAGHGQPDQHDDGHRVAAFCGEVTVPAGGEICMDVVMGYAGSVAEARDVVRSLGGVKASQRALAETRQWWLDALSRLQIETNLPEFDRFVNTWLPYQVLTSRLWGRTGPEQRSGAWGFRDQLQDVLPIVFLDTALVRRQILWHAAQQFLEGDALAWWHAAPDGGTGLGARTRASDVHLWLPHVVARYVGATGDAGILDVDIPFLEGVPIPPAHEGIVFAPRSSPEKSSLYEHCRRAVEFTLARKGRHGLPLMGTGDWNDGLSAVGAKGRGESVWLAFFLHEVLQGMVPLAAQRGDGACAERWKKEADALRAATGGMWRGDRYVRAVDDSGTELILADALMGAWPVISGVADLDRGRTAVGTALRELEREASILLLHPPFTDTSANNPGRITDYPPGVRENGGQYSHGSSWLIDALVRLAELSTETSEADAFRARAVECWMKVSPLDDVQPGRLARYGLPPHQQPADIYDGPGYEGRGGWSWYSGSAARMLSAAHAMLGLRMENGQMIVGPHAFEGAGGLMLKRVVWHGTEHVRQHKGHQA